MEGRVIDPQALKNAMTVLKFANIEGVATFSPGGGFIFGTSAPYGSVSYQLLPSGFADFKCAANIPPRELKIFGFKTAMEEWAPTESVTLKAKVLGNKLDIELEFCDDLTGVKRTVNIDRSPLGNGIVPNSYDMILHTRPVDSLKVTVRADKFAETVHFLNECGERATITSDGGLLFSSWGYPAPKSQTTPNRTKTINDGVFGIDVHSPDEEQAISKLNMVLGFSRSLLEATQYVKGMTTTSTKNFKNLKPKNLVMLRYLPSGAATYVTFNLAETSGSDPEGCQTINFIFNHKKSNQS